MFTKEKISTILAPFITDTAQLESVLDQVKTEIDSYIEGEKQDSPIIDSNRAMIAAFALPRIISLNSEGNIDRLATKAVGYADALIKALKQ